MNKKLEERVKEEYGQVGQQRCQVIDVKIHI
jgi:hypothetical protein